MSLALRSSRGTNITRQGWLLQGSSPATESVMAHIDPLLAAAIVALGFAILAFAAVLVT
jgi:hypothetical protein